MKTIAKLKETRNVEVVLQVKRNQKNLLQKCADLAKARMPFSKSIRNGRREHGRIEKRTVAVFRKEERDLPDTWDDHVKSVIKVERETRIFNTKTKQFDKSGETALYVSTTDVLSAEEFGRVIRSHWGIENSNHYVRDVSLREDFSRVRKNPENVATLRSFALNILRMNGETNISQTLYRNAVNVSRVLNYSGVGR